MKSFIELATHDIHRIATVLGALEADIAKHANFRAEKAEALRLSSDLLHALANAGEQMEVGAEAAHENAEASL